LNLEKKGRGRKEIGFPVVKVKPWGRPINLIGQRKKNKTQRKAKPERKGENKRGGYDLAEGVKNRHCHDQVTENHVRGEQGSRSPSRKFLVNNGDTKAGAVAKMEEIMVEYHWLGQGRVE